MSDLSYSKQMFPKHENGSKCTPSSRKDHWETADNYNGEIFRHGMYRVAVCRDDNQWLFQRQRPRFQAGGAPWDTLGYCVSKSGLARLVRAHINVEAAEFEALLEDFPERFRNG